MTTARDGIARAVDWRLYFVTDTELCGGAERVPWVVEQAVLGGVGVVQVRDKTMDDAEYRALTLACVAANEQAFDQCGRRAAIVVNDRLSVAVDLGLHFHQGQSDGAVAEARRLLGPEAIIGLSIPGEAEARAELADQSADVLAMSPVWSTPTKTDTDPELGLEETARLVRIIGERAITLGIGGIKPHNARSVIDTGVNGVCVISAIATAADPRAASAKLLDLWEKK